METSEKILEAIADSLKSIRRELDVHRSGNVSDATEIGYRKLYENMCLRVDYENGIALADAILQTRSKNTYYSRLSACRHTILSLIASETGSALNAASNHDIASVNHSIAKIENLKSEFAQTNMLLDGCKLRNICKRKSKRQSLSGLPDDWREQLFIRMRNSKFSLPMLIAAITGCRPVELRNGVVLDFLSEGGSQYLVATISGAKVTEKNGQPQRQLFFSIDQPSFLLRALIYEVEKNDCKMLITIENEKAFSVAITRFGKILWPKHKQDLTAYSLRHAFSSDMKLSSSKDMTAKSLGHASIRTQKTYGQRQLSKSKRLSVPSKVIASRVVREQVEQPIFKIDFEQAIRCV